MKRATPSTADILSFYIVTSDNEPIPFESKILSYGGKNFSDGADSVDYGLYLTKPIQSAKTCMLHVLLKDAVLFSTVLYPAGGPLDKCHLMDRVYPVFETHQLAQDPDETLTYAVYIQFDNTSRNTTPIIGVAVDMTLSFLPNAFPNRFERVPYFPYDVDPAKYGLKIETRKIPQRTPLWFRLRGEVTGSKAYKLMGFWIPTVAENPDWKYDTPEVFSDTSKANMRLGTHSEEYAIMLLLLNCPAISVSLVGLCDPPPGAGVPVGWGASPDGLLIDTSVTWDNLPTSITQHITDRERFDPRRGVLEIKSSAKKLSMEAYFLPQVYLEMISTGTLWCDVVRFCRTSSYDTGSKKWVYSNVARIYRVYRHIPTEQALVALIKRAHGNRHALQKIVAEHDYVQMRQYFATLASEAPYKEIHTPSSIPEFELYEKHKRDCIQVDTHFKVESVKRAKTAPNPALGKMDERHQLIQAGKATIPLVLDQIQDYHNLLLVLFRDIQ